MQWKSRWPWRTSPISDRLANRHRRQDAAASALLATPHLIPALRYPPPRQALAAEYDLCITGDALLALQQQQEMEAAAARRQRRAGAAGTPATSPPGALEGGQGQAEDVAVMR